MKLTAYDLAPNKQEYLSQFFIASRTADAWAIWQRAAKWGAS